MPKKKKSADLTPRQQLSQRIMREKAARKKRLALRRRTQIIGCTTLAVAMMVGGGWLWFSGAGTRLIDKAVHDAYQTAAGAGFSVQDVYLEGRNRTPMKAINAALALKKNESIFQVDLDAMRADLEKIESVKMAAVERALPHTLYVRIVEREPIALWQHNGQLIPIDDNGVVMHGVDSKPYMHLPLMVGAGAPAHSAELMAVLATEDGLAKRFSVGIYTGERRWNIRLENGIEVKLPEKDPVTAWKTLAALHEKEQLLDRAVKVIDLRLEGRLFITTATPRETVKPAAQAKET